MTPPKVGESGLQITLPREGFDLREGKCTEAVCLKPISLDVRPAGAVPQIPEGKLLSGRETGFGGHNLIKIENWRVYCRAERGTPALRTNVVPNHHGLRKNAEGQPFPDPELADAQLFPDQPVVYQARLRA